MGTNNQNGIRVIYNSNNNSREVIIDFCEECFYDFKKEAILIKSLYKQIKRLLKYNNYKSVVVFGLGNYGMVADSLGIKCCNKIITNSDSSTKVFSFKTGIEFYTGIETAKTIKAIIGEIKPELCILVDSMVASDFGLLGKSIQLKTGGIVPGGGLGKRGKKIDEVFLQIPVLSIGVPVLVQTSTITKKYNNNQNVVLTLKNIDEIIDKTSKIIAYAIDLCFTDLTLCEIKKVFE